MGAKSQDSRCGEPAGCVPTVPSPRGGGGLDATIYQRGRGFLDTTRPSSSSAPSSSEEPNRALFATLAAQRREVGVQTT